MEGLNSSAGRSRAPILDRMSALADPIRCRILLLVERHELTVSELCAILQSPQSTVSRHLKVLADDGWLTARKDGTSRLYSIAHEDAEPAAGRLWGLVREEIAASTAAGEDRRRLREVLAERRSRSQEFFSSAAGRWAQLRRELFGERFDLLALLGLLDERWTVGDLGAGTGLLARSLAPFVHRVVAVDESAAMLAAAERRLEDLPNVELRHGTLERLPIADGELDAAMLVLVLHHLAEPERALREAARTLRPGGRLLLVDMLPHEREEFRREMGHQALGFEPEKVERALRLAGFESFRWRPLPPDPAAKGPTLFVAGARTPDRKPTTA